MNPAESNLLEKCSTERPISCFRMLKSFAAAGVKRLPRLDLNLPERVVRREGLGDLGGVALVTGTDADRRQSLRFDFQDDALLLPDAFPRLPNGEVVLQGKGHRRLAIE